MGGRVGECCTGVDESLRGHLEERMGASGDVYPSYWRDCTPPRNNLTNLNL